MQHSTHACDLKQSEPTPLGAHTKAKRRLIPLESNFGHVTRAPETSRGSMVKVYFY